MMINKRLIGAVPESRKYIAGNVAVQWISLAANIGMMGSIAHLLPQLLNNTAGTGSILATVVIGLIALAVRFACALAASRMGYLSSKAVKSTPALTVLGLLIYALWPFVFPQSVYAGLVIGTVIF